MKVLKNLKFTSLILFLTTFLLGSKPLKAADYIEYNQIISKIKVDVFNDRKEEALDDFENKIYKNYQFIFAEDIFMATQLAVSINKKVLAEKYIEKCVVQGVPFLILKNDRIIGKLKSDKEWKIFFEKFGLLHKKYLENINLKLKNTIDSLFKVDTPETHKMNKYGVIRTILFYPKWRRVVNRNFKTIVNIIKEYGYPGEQLIGLQLMNNNDSLSLSKRQVGIRYSLGSSQVFNMILHYYSSAKPDINELLQNSLKNGYLPASHYASFNDFIAKYGKKKYKNNYYNEWHKNQNIDLEEINKKRTNLGMLSLEAKQMIYQEWNLVYFKRKPIDEFIYIPFGGL